VVLDRLSLTEAWRENFGRIAYCAVIASEAKQSIHRAFPQGWIASSLQVKPQCGFTGAPRNDGKCVGSRPSAKFRS
jgi:hypothetical protein